MRNAFAEEITNLAKKDKKIVLLSADIGNRLFDKFRTRCWHFIVKKKFLHLNNIYFKNIKISEDWVFVSQILCLAQSFKIIEKPTYIYQRFEPNTLSISSGYIFVISHIKVIYEIGLFVNKKKKFLNKLEIKFLFTMLRKSTEL